MSFPTITDDMSEETIEGVLESAKSATDFMKALAHEGRLMILCHLVTGEKSVTELENLLSSRQAAVSQQLARLRLESPQAASSLRDYGTGAQILLDLGVRNMILISNSRQTVVGLDGYGLHIVGHAPLTIEKV